MRAWVTILGIGLVAGAANGALPAASGTWFTLPEGSGYRMFVPANFQPSNQIDLVVHFHGSDTGYAANDAYAGLNAISVTIQLGALSSAYQTPFTGSSNNLFQNVMDDALAKARAQANIPDTATWGKVGVTSFSAGYAAVREILKQPRYYNRIDGMVLADTVYASYTSGTDLTPLDSQMADFRRYAQDAVAGKKSLVFTHSQVPTSGYCNTVATGDDLLQTLGLSATPVNVDGLGGIHFYREAAKGNFTFYGATGSDGAAHLLHQNYIAQWEPMMGVGVPEPATAGALLTLAGLRRRRAPGAARA